MKIRLRKSRVSEKMHEKKTFKNFEFVKMKYFSEPDLDPLLIVQGRYHLWKSTWRPIASTVANKSTTKAKWAIMFVKGIWTLRLFVDFAKLEIKDFTSSRICPQLKII